MTTNEIIHLGREVIRNEIEGLEEILNQVDGSFARAVECIAALTGRVVLTGVGKSGIIARKIAATMVSIGTPAIFIHPVEGLHGDLGAIMPQDAAIILSNSGSTHEICELLPSLQSLGIPIIAITGNPDSPLGRQAHILLRCTVTKEACALGLAPTTSTTAQLALGDALAVVLSELKGFDRDDFRVFHPAGALGKQLMIRISQIMLTGEEVPFVPAHVPLETALCEMTAKSLGFTLVGSENDIQGIITDGDLRRILIRQGQEIRDLTAGDVMTCNPKSIREDMLALDALDIMEKLQITSLCVTNDGQRFRGVVHLHDLLGRGRLGLKEP